MKMMATMLMRMFMMVMMMVWKVPVILIARRKPRQPIQSVMYETTLLCGLVLAK